MNKIVLPPTRAIHPQSIAYEDLVSKIMTKERLIELVNDKTVNFLFEKFQLLFSEWPAIYVLNSCPLEMQNWFEVNCHKDSLGFYYFPDEPTFAMFLFKFPGVIPSNLWFEPLFINDDE